ncbi:MAG: dipicolinate synthase subunit B [Clostridia bacterium]|nr:dipicolinate synthase subunit B [Clostridia bacterium]
MNLSDFSIGFGLTGSFCTITAVLDELKKLKNAGADIYPVLSFNVSKLDNRFNKADQLKKSAEEICGRKPIDTIQGAEPFGPKNLIDIFVIAPCTGNTLSKLANGITDTPVTMAAKATLRNNKPVVIAVSTNDGLSGSAKNIGLLLNSKNYYFVPFGQDDCINKETSLVAKMELILPTINNALNNKQIQPILQ